MSPLLEAPPRSSRTNGRVPPLRPRTGGDDDADGDAGPRRVLLDNVVLATIFFIGAEAMFFTGLVFSFWILRLAAPVWPPPLQPRLPLGVTGLNTLVLLASSAAMVAASRALRAEDRRLAVRRLGTAAGLGALFLLVQGYEWARLIRFGLTVTSGAYGATFYTLIGTHAAHVVGALIWLSLTLLLLARGRFADGRTAPFRACALFWHFVVGLWPVLYLSVYLL